MSSHCSRYPSCGCSSAMGTKCQLPEGDVRLLEKEKDWESEEKMLKWSETRRDANGYPLLENGEIDWELTSKEKEAVRLKFDRFDSIANGGTGEAYKKPHRKHASNYTPPKKRRSRQKRK